MATFVMTAAGQFVTSPWPQQKNERLTTAPGSDARQLQIQWDTFLSNFAAMLACEGGNSPQTTFTPSLGTTNTVAISAGTVSIAGAPSAVSASTGTAFGSLGTIPASTWGLIAADLVANGTVSFVSAAASYTTGYATEALAIAAMPAYTASKARIFYLTILASASTWIAGTDGLTGSVTGNPATTTNYYPIWGYDDANFWTANQIANQAGTVLTSAQY